MYHKTRLQSFSRGSMAQQCRRHVLSCAGELLSVCHSETFFQFSIAISDMLPFNVSIYISLKGGVKVGGDERGGTG